MNPTGTSQFNQARIEWAIRLRYSPMPNLDMKFIASNLNAFRIGEMRVVGKIWEVMMERDGELALNADKRASDLAGLEWNVVSDGSPDGDRHARALEYFYKHLRATRALDQDAVGGMSELLYQMATAHSYYYSAHEILLRIDNAAAQEVTAEFRHTPIWFFESRRGYLAYLEHIFDVYGQPCAEGEWLTCVGLGWMRPLSMAFAMKHFQLRDWLIFSQRYGSGFIEAITDSQKGDAAWEEARETLRSLSNDGAVIHSQGVSLKFLDTGAKNSSPFEGLVERVDRLYAKCYRGIDLATTSRAPEQGAGRNVVGASVQKEESGIFLARDAAWATGCLNERVDRPIIRYLFNQEPRAGVAIMPPLDDTAAQDLKAVQALAPMGLRISLAEAYKRFRWRAPAPGEKCLTVAGMGRTKAGQDVQDGQDNGGGEAGQPVNLETKRVSAKEGNGEKGLLSLPSSRMGGTRVGKTTSESREVGGARVKGTSSALLSESGRLRRSAALPEPRQSGSSALPGKNTAIGAGARNGKFQTSSGAMPDPQADAANFKSNQP